eukprot:6999961-Prymnesium_polylepis.2
MEVKAACAYSGQCATPRGLDEPAGADATNDAATQRLALFPASVQGAARGPGCSPTFPTSEAAAQTQSGAGPPKSPQRAGSQGTTPARRRAVAAG